MLISVLAALMLQPAPGAPDPAAFELEEVVVVGRRHDVRIVVEVAGDLDESSLVLSEPDGVRCGGEAWRYSPVGRPRGCWIRRATGQSVVLRARDDRDARAVFTGCDADSTPDTCRIAVGVDDRVVTARFERP